VLRIGDKVRWTRFVTGNVMRGTIKTIDTEKFMQGTIKTIVSGQAMVQTDKGTVVGVPLGHLEQDD
jgi:hypothetical protein